LRDLAPSPFGDDLVGPLERIFEGSVGFLVALDRREDRIGSRWRRQGSRCGQRGAAAAAGMAASPPASAARRLRRPTIRLSRSGRRAPAGHV
jgi:hypothetical protein